MSEKKFPTIEEAKQVHKDLFLMRATEAFRTFYPAVSQYAVIKDCLSQGAIANQKYIVFKYASPSTNALTANSDTCYGIVILDLSDGPMVVEVPSGGFLGVCNSVYFNEIGNFGFPGPDKGNGGKYVIAPKGYDQELPDDCFVLYSETNLLTCAMRVTALDGNQEKAMNTMMKINTYRLGENGMFPQTEFVEFTEKAINITPTIYETTIDYWEIIHEILQDRLLPEYFLEYGRLANIGIRKEQVFNPTTEEQDLLLKAAKNGIRQMRVEAFASPFSECLIWPERKWEWVGIVPGTGYYSENYRDNFASDRWFFQATLSSKVMFPRKAIAGSEYLLGIRDDKNNYLDGEKTYSLLIPKEVPANIFWSVTVYDGESRSEIITDTNRASISSLHTNIPLNEDGMMEVFFGPEAPSGKESYWIKTNPNEQWFCYFRVYGPKEDLYNGSWKLGDFTEIH